MGIKVEGVDRLASKFAATPDRVERETRNALGRIGADLHGKSVRAAPIDEGDLRASGYYDVDGAKFSPELDVGFYGLPYIIVQHEGGWRNLIAWGRSYGPTQIKNHPGGGGPPPSKFLERPYLENLPRYKLAIRDAANKGLHG